MKLSLLILLLPSLGFSAEVLEGKRIKRFFSRDFAELSIQYSGGCTKHLFSLKPMGCEKDNDVCEMKLMHDRQGDQCEMVVQQKIRLRVPRGRKICKSTWWVRGENETSIKIEK